MGTRICEILRGACPEQSRRAQDDKLPLVI
jgi:hypothetical protein